MVTQRLDVPLPAGHLSYSHHRAIHRHIFGDVYAWAGRIRTGCISKGQQYVLLPEHAGGEMQRPFAKPRKVGLFRNLTRFP